MFSAIDKNKRLIRILLVVLIVPPFAFFGLEAYTNSSGGRDEVASVNGQSVTLREFTEQLQRQQERMRGLFGPSFDLSAVDTPEMRLNLVESIVGQRLVAAEVDRARIRIDDVMLQQAIAAIPRFHVDGRFSHAAYEAVLRAQGLSPGAFEEQYRRELARSLLVRAISETVIVPSSVAERLSSLIEQKREVSEAIVPVQPLIAGINIQPAQVRAYYDANASEFRIPERVRVEYVELAAEDLATQEQVTEEELKSAYEAKIGQIAGAEQRRVSHVLIDVPAGATDEVRKAARAKADGLLAELRRAPARFADVARRESRDTTTASRGGDIGFIARGGTIKAIEDAAFGLREGEMSGVVESEFGYHIVRLTAVQGARPPALDSLRSELTVELQKQKVMRRFAKDAEAFGNLAYEQADSLDPVVKQFGLKRLRSPWLDAGAAAESRSPLSHPKLRTALFSSDSIQARRNTEAVEVAPGRVVAARVVEHEPASLRKFEEVNAAIEQKLRLAEASRIAQQQGETLLSSLRKGETVSLSWGAPRSVSRRDPAGLAPDAARLIAAAEATSLPAYVGAQAGDRGFAIYRISSVTQPEARTEAQTREDVEQLRQITASAEFEAYVAGLRNRGSVKIRPEAIEKK